MSALFTAIAVSSLAVHDGRIEFDVDGVTGLAGANFLVFRVSWSQVSRQYNRRWSSIFPCSAPEGSA